MRAGRTYTARRPPRSVPRFYGTRDLKFSAEDQAAIRRAETAFGYPPQARVSSARPWITIAAAAALVILVLLGIARFVRSVFAAPPRVENGLRVRPGDIPGKTRRPARRRRAGSPRPFRAQESSSFQNSRSLRSRKEVPYGHDLRQ